MNISYEIGDKLYLNITNKCPCQLHILYSSQRWRCLWLWPTVAGTSANCRRGNRQHQKAWPWQLQGNYFCGYGEPTCELEILKETAKYIKSVTKTPVRINTNGLSDLINKRETPTEFKGLVDIISISLNASDAKAYDEVTRPSFKGVNCFEEMLSFAKEWKSSCRR